MEKAAALPLLLCLLLSCHCSRPSLAQTSIPPRPQGFIYADDDLYHDSVIVDAFLDPLCPDSRDSWPPLKEAFEHYDMRLSLVVHPFPLPYHDNAFLACRALHIANKLNRSSTFPLLELFFENQEKYYNAPTENMSRASIIRAMARLAVPVVGNSTSEFLSGFNDWQTDTAARISFKYGCSKGVSFAPFFYVNGFPLHNPDSPLDFDAWKSIIDPLLLEDDEEEKDDESLSFEYIE